MLNVKGSGNSIPIVPVDPVDRPFLCFVPFFITTFPLSEKAGEKGESGGIGLFKLLPIKMESLKKKSVLMGDDAKRMGLGRKSTIGDDCDIAGVRFPNAGGCSVGPGKNVEISTKSPTIEFTFVWIERLGRCFACSFNRCCSSEGNSIDEKSI